MGFEKDGLPKIRISVGVLEIVWGTRSASVLKNRQLVGSNPRRWRAMRLPGFQPTNVETFSPSNTLVQGAHTLARGNGTGWRLSSLVGPRGFRCEMFDLSEQIDFELAVVSGRELDFGTVSTR